MPKSVKPKKSSGPPRRGSKWSAVWDALMKRDPVPVDEDDAGWLEYTCKDAREAKLLQSALHQRSLRERNDWRVQTQMQGKTIYFRRVWIETDDDTQPTE